MNQIKFILFLFLTPLVVNAQKPNEVKIGEITPEEWALEKVSFEEDAPAVVLFDKIFFEYHRPKSRGTKAYRYKRHVRIKILNKDGYDKADVTIPYYHIRGRIKESVYDIKGATHNRDNGKTTSIPLSEVDIHELENTKVKSSKNIVFPKVKEGSIIEYEYSFESNDGPNFETWYFQSDIPTLYSEWRFGDGDFYYYNTEFVKPEYLSKNQSYNMIYAKNVHSLKNEPMAPLIDDHKCQLNYFLGPLNIDFQTFNKRILGIEELSMNLLGKRPSFQQIIENEITGKTDLEKASSLFKFIQSNVEWNGTRSWTLWGDVENTLTQKSGSSSEINLLLISILRQAGFKAYPVICSTRSNGIPNQTTPRIRDFNAMICQVKIGDKFYLADASSDVLPFGLIHPSHLNGHGWKLNLHDNGWIDLKQSAKASNTSSVKIKWEDGRFIGSIKSKHLEYGSLMAIINKSRQADITRSDFLLESVNESWNPSVPKFKIDENTLNCTSTIQIEQQPEDEDIIYLDVNVLPIYKENPFTKEERQLPVDFHFESHERIITMVDIPEGYEVESLPESKSFKLQNDGGKFIYEIKKINNQIQINTFFKLNQLEFTQYEYSALKEFIQLSLETTEQLIVLKKV